MYDIWGPHGGTYYNSMLYTLLDRYQHFGLKAASVFRIQHLDSKEKGSNFPWNASTYLLNYSESHSNTVIVSKLSHTKESTSSYVTTCHCRRVVPTALSRFHYWHEHGPLNEKANTLTRTFQALCIFEKVTIWMLDL